MHSRVQSRVQSRFYNFPGVVTVYCQIFISRAHLSRDTRNNRVVFSIVAFIMATPVVTENDVHLETSMDKEVSCRRHYGLILALNVICTGGGQG